MAAEGSGARLLRNTLVNGLGTFGGVALNLVVTPFIVAGLGTEAFGVWALALSVTVVGGYASLTDLGIEQAAARYVAEARSDGDQDEVNRVASNAMVVFAVVALVLTPIFVAISGPLTELFGVSESLRDAAQLCFALTAAQLAFELPARTYFAVLEGVQRFELFQLLELIRTLTMIAVIVATLVADWGVGALGGSLTASSAAVLVAGWFVAHRSVGGLRLSPRLLDRATMGKLVKLGGGLFMIRGLSTVYRQMNKLVIGIALGPRAVAVFEIANRIQTGAWMVQNVAASALVPTTAFRRHDKAALRDTFLTGTKFAVAATLPFAVGAIVFAQPLVLGWVGEDLREAVGPTRLLVAYLCFAVVQVVGITMIVALGRLRPFIAVLSLNVVVNLVIGVATVGSLGVEGVVLATLVGQAVAWYPMQRLLLKTFDVGWREWLRAVVVPNLPGLAVQGAVAALMLLLLGDTTSLLLAFLMTGASIVASWAAFALVGLRREELTAFLERLREALGRSRPVSAPESSPTSGA